MTLNGISCEFVADIIRCRDQGARWDVAPPTNVESAIVKLLQKHKMETTSY